MIKVVKKSDPFKSPLLDSWINVKQFFVMKRTSIWISIDIRLDLYIESRYQIRDIR
jgi:hypothetical protein